MADRVAGGRRSPRMTKPRRSTRVWRPAIPETSSPADFWPRPIEAWEKRSPAWVAPRRGWSSFASHCASSIRCQSRTPKTWTCTPAMPTLTKAWVLPPRRWGGGGKPLPGTGAASRSGKKFESSAAACTLKTSKACAAAERDRALRGGRKAAEISSGNSYRPGSLCRADSFSCCGTGSPGCP